MELGVHHNWPCVFGSTGLVSTVARSCLWSQVAGRRAEHSLTTRDLFDTSSAVGG